jgi:hypothetical protein
MSPHNRSVFLCHNSADKKAVLFIAHKLQEHGVKVWIDRWSLVPGEPFQAEIERALSGVSAVAVLVGPSGQSPWQDAEMQLAIDRRITSKDSRVIPVLLPGAKKSDLKSRFLAQATWVEFEEGLQDEEALSRLIAGIEGRAPGPAGRIASTQTITPYRGLAYFDVQHAGIFFGRGDVTDRLLEKLRHSRFVGILGASGSGKSSVARAGVLAALAQDMLPGSSRWPAVAFTPGSKPLENLAYAICDAAGAPRDGIKVQEQIEAFRRGNNLLHLALRGSDAKPERIVLLVDQFEEVFAGSVSKEDRGAFIDNLVYAATTEGGPGVVIITMRADRYGDCASHPDLGQVISASHELLGEMTPGQLREAIEKPALAAGSSVEPALVAELLREIAAKPGCLPLLQYLLRSMWDQSPGEPLSYSRFAELGGIAGALAQRAEEAYSKLEPPQQQSCRSLFLSLVEPGPEGRFFRRSVPLERMELAGGMEVLGALADARLITLTPSGQVGSEILVQVVHETLFTAWPRLHAWLQQDEELLLWQRRLNVKLLDWEKRRRAHGTYLEGVLLLEAEEWAKRRPEAIASEQAQYIRASRRRELKRKLRLYVSVAAVVIAALAGWWWVSRVRHVDYLISQARSLMEAKPPLALALAFEANIRRGRETAGLLQDAYQAASSPPIEHDDNTKAIYDVAFSKDGHWMATAGQDGTARLWNASYTEVARVEVPGYARAVAIRPQADLLVAAGGAGTLKLLATTVGQVQLLKTGAADLTAVAFSPDGSWFVAAASDGHIHRFTVPPDGQPARTYGPLDTGVVNAIGVSPDGQRFAAGGEEFRIIFTDASAGNQSAPPFQTTAPVKDLSFSRDGRVGAACLSGQASVFDPAGKVPPFSPVESGVASAALSSDGEHFAVATADGAIGLWSVQSRQRIATFRTDGIATKLQFNWDGTKLAAANDRGKVRIYELSIDTLRIRVLEVMKREGAEIMRDCGEYLSHARCVAYAGGAVP